MSLATFLPNQAMSDLSDSPIFLKQDSDVTLTLTHATIGWAGYSEILILLFIIMIHDDSSRTGGHSISNPVSKDRINATI